MGLIKVGHCDKLLCCGLVVILARRTLCKALTSVKVYANILQLFRNTNCCDIMNRMVCEMKVPENF
jgi:hypothetical protein